MKQDTVKYKSLIEMAKQNEYYATCPTNGLTAASREFYANKAAALRAEANALPDDFQDPEFTMPAWGTYGT